MIRLRNRARTCWHVTGYEPCCCGTPGCLSPWRIYCERRIGWWASWWTDRCTEHLAGTTLWLAWVLASPSLAWHAFAYWVRPYDMVADARRWWFRRPACWRATRSGRDMQARLTRHLNDRDGGR